MQATMKSLGIDRMSIDDRMNLMEEIWESIASQPDGGKIPQWHKDILDRRLAECESNPEATIPREEAMARIREKLSRRQG